ncbi:AAA family protein [Cyclospora cayetanensis]|uniref:Peroxisomal ATPase PEX6 n=1 Tax=Cyclospora cayetanensis TaxID=88456 RepID=A0A1D3D973_9EIME|nr:AAA family protein [Cyclospora cayetanensis]
MSTPSVRRRARALRLLYPISTQFTSLDSFKPPALEGSQGSSAGAPSLAQSREDRLRDSFSECYCLSPSLGALSCKANAWIWVGPLGEGASEPPRRRLLRLLALSNEQEKPPGASCQCWMEALAVPHPGGRASPQEGLPNPEAAREAPDTATSPHSERPPHDGAPFSEPVLFLPPHVLSALGLTPGEGFVEIWQASEFDSRPPLSTPALPEAFRRLPMASHCQLQQLAAPPNDSWNLLGASLGGPPEGQASPQEIHELLNDFFCVPRLLTVGDVFGVLRKPYRYGAPCCRAPCNAGAPAGTRPFSGGCPCCLSLHEIEHAEAFGLGPFRCERLASKVLFEAGTSVNGGPLFCVCASEASERPLGTEEAQGKGQTDSSRNSPGGPSAPHEPSPEEAKAGAPTLRRRRRAFGCRGGKGGPLCHWEAADPLFGCGCGETLHQVAVLFRVAALEGPQERLSCAVVVRRGTDLLLQEALAKEGPPPFGADPLCSIQDGDGDAYGKPRQRAALCGAPFLVQRICNALGFHYVSMNCHALAPSVAEAAAAKGITHSDGTTAPGGNSLLSAALVEGSSGGAPCIILLQHVSALMCDPGAPASRLDRLDSLLAAHLRWFLRSHEQQGPPGLLRAPVLVVGVCDSESEGVTDGLGPELRSAFELTVQVQRPDRETREEVFRRLNEASHAFRFPDQEEAASRGAQEFAELAVGLTIQEMKRLFCCLLEAAADAPLNRNAQGSLTFEPKAEEGLHCTDKDSKAGPPSVLGKLLNLSLKELRTAVKPFQSDADAAAANIAEVHWGEVGGMEDAKEQIRQLITLPLQHPKLFSGVQLRGGCLLFGPPGTGKTLIAKAIATECDVNFIAVKGPELLNKYIGESEKNVRDLFAKARACQPCVLFFDEIDALLPRRGRASDSGGVLDRVVSQVLAEIDDLPPKVFIIGATNRIELLDGAALRAGRMDRCVYVGIQQDKGPILRALLMHLVVRQRAPSCLSSLHKGEVEVEAVIEELTKAIPPGCTGADCKALCNAASLLATRERIYFAQTLERALGLSPTELQEAALQSWRSIDHSSPLLGDFTCIATLWRHCGGVEPTKAPQMTLGLLANTQLPDGNNAEGLQVWRGCIDSWTGEEAADPRAVEGAADNACVLWVISTLPTSAVASSAAKEAQCTRGAGTLQLLCLQNDRRTESLQRLAETAYSGGNHGAHPALLNGKKAAVWITRRQGHASQPGCLKEGLDAQKVEPLSILGDLIMHEGPPPCFVFAIHVLERHLRAALEELHPSVTAQDLRRYEHMRDQYAVKT